MEMFHKRGDIGHSELKDYEYRCYEDLKRGYYKIKISSSSYSCPFCSGKSRDDYNSRELLNHASRVASAPRSWVSKEKAEHVALERYMRRHLDDRRNPEPVAVENRHGLQRDALTKLPDDDKSVSVPNRPGIQRAAVTKPLDDDQYVAVAKDPSLHDDQYAAVAKPLEGDHCGKRDYYTSKNRGDRWYGWMARDNDYHLRNILEVNLRKREELKTISEREAEDNELMMHDEMFDFHKEINDMHQRACDHFEKICVENEKVRLHLEAQKKELEIREKELLQRDAHDKFERQKIALQKKMNEKAMLEQKMADARVLRLAEEQKKEKEKFFKKIIELQKKLDAKQVLEFSTELTRGTLAVLSTRKDEESS